MKRNGWTTFYLSGAPLEKPAKIFRGEYDAVLIRLAPEDRTPEELEELILHELVHVAFPKASTGGKTKSWGRVECEKWVNAKVKQLLKQHGYVVHQGFSAPSMNGAH
jgi:hypothetical protein